MKVTEQMIQDYKDLEKHIEQSILEHAKLEFWGESARIGSWEFDGDVISYYVAHKDGDMTNGHTEYMPIEYLWRD